MSVMLGITPKLDSLAPHKLKVCVAQRVHSSTNTTNLNGCSRRVAEIQNIGCKQRCRKKNVKIRHSNELRKDYLKHRLILLNVFTTTSLSIRIS